MCVVGGGVLQVLTHLPPSASRTRVYMCVWVCDRPFTYVRFELKNTKKHLYRIQICLLHVFVSVICKMGENLTTTVIVFLLFTRITHARTLLTCRVLVIIYCKLSNCWACSFSLRSLKAALSVSENVV